MTLPEHAVILLAEDLANDALLVRRAFDSVGVKNPVHVVRDGEQCLAHIKGLGQYSNRDQYPLPDILLLDLKMPKLDGFEVLAQIRADKAFAALRIIVLTSSEEVRDISKAYELGANSFLVKPIEFDKLTLLMRRLSDFWLQENKAPRLSKGSFNA